MTGDWQTYCTHNVKQRVIKAQPPTTHVDVAVTHACTQRSETKKHELSIAKPMSHSVVPSHSSHNETRRNDAHATTKIRNRNTAAQHPTHYARDTRILHRAYDEP
jgi:hypothetical protein